MRAAERDDCTIRETNMDLPERESEQTAHDEAGHYVRSLQSSDDSSPSPLTSRATPVAAEGRTDEIDLLDEIMGQNDDDDEFEDVPLTSAPPEPMSYDMDIKDAPDEPCGEEIPPRKASSTCRKLDELEDEVQRLQAEVKALALKNAL